MIRLVAFDLDHTLLGEENVISQRNQKAVGLILKQGVDAIICTGRMFCSAIPFAQKLGLKSPLICDNGALIRDMSGKKIIHEPIRMNLAKKVLKIAQELDIHANLFYDDKWFFKEWNEEAEFYQNKIGVKGVEVGDLRDFLSFDPTKIVFIVKPSYIHELWDYLRKQFMGKLNITVSSERNIAILSPQVNKGRALTILYNQMGLSKQEVLAIGDNYNDIDFFNAAGLSVAMGNAPEVVKRAATYVTSTNVKDGVAEALNRYVLIR